MKTISLTSIESQAAACTTEPSAAAERLELLHAEIEAQARDNWNRGEDSEAMAGWLKASALRFAIRTLQSRLDDSAIETLRTSSFEPARLVLWNAANDWTQVAGIALAVPDPETQGSALANAAALRYAAQLLVSEVPVTEAALAA